ncbi:MAG: EAL domain-containing protein [Lachnospiraceae bacterium]|nr:EAL domain-containing protein [Lachnospiraceae bacterium]
MLRGIAQLLGFRKNSAYVNRSIQDMNIRTSVYMAVITIGFEVYMYYYILKKRYWEIGVPFDASLYFQQTKNYLILLLTGLMLLLVALFYQKNNQAWRRMGYVATIAFSVISLYFGFVVSFDDYMNGKQILAFLTMSLYAACLLIWRPYISMIMLAGVYYFFFSTINAAVEGGMRTGDKVNLFTYWLGLTVVVISIYHQRREVAEKTEHLEAANRRLQNIAIYDELTRIHNAYYFYEEAAKIFADADMDYRDKLYLFVNLENFKYYNDRFGFKAGNEFLGRAAHIIEEAFQGSLVARQSDDHFLILTDVVGAEERIEQMRRQIVNMQHEVRIGVKFGIYFPESKTIDPQYAVDKARYACSLTRDRFDKDLCIYDDKVANGFRRRQYIVNNLQMAIDAGYIQPFYQPVVWAKDGSLCGCEALARWIDPTYGFLSPGDFIPVLEDYRVIHQLDACIFECVCRDLRNAMDEGRPVVPVSINFSRLDFELMDDAVLLLENLVEKYQIPKDMLHVEITESAISDCLDGIRQAMDRLHDSGYALWLDDFGSGYSSLNTLKDFQFDVMKIDMAFLHGFENNPKAKSLLNYVVNLADNMEMRSLTEGVETEEQAEFLRAAGCGRLQGYFYGKPMSISELRDRINDGTYRVAAEM